MNFSAFHILKKDFRLVGRYLFAWCAVLLCRAYWIMLSVDAVRHPESTRVADLTASASFSLHQWLLEWSTYCLLFFTYAGSLLLGYIVAVVLKADSPIDERALWRTRPVAGRAMLRAKLLFLGLFGILVPCAIETALRLHYGFDARECLRGIVETTVIYAAGMGVVASAALLFQRTFFGLVIFLGIWIVGFFIFAALDHFHWLDWLGPNFVLTPHAGWFGMGTGFVLATLSAVTMLVLAWLMYNGASRWQGAKVLAGGLVLAFVAALLCRIMFFARQEISYPPDSSRKMTWQAPPANTKYLVDSPNDIFLTANGPIIVNATVTTGNENDDSHAVSGWIPQQSIATTSAEIVRIMKIQSSLNWPASPTRLLVGDYQDWDWYANFVNTQAVFATAGYGRLLGYFFDEEYPTSLVRAHLNDLDFRLARLKSGRWTTEIDCEGGHLVCISDTPAREGAQWQDKSLHYSLGAGLTGADAPVRNNWNYAFPLNEVRPYDYLLQPALPSDESFPVFLLYNPLKKECIEGFLPDQISRADPMSILSIFDLNQQNLVFNNFYKTDNTDHLLRTSMTDDEIRAWVADAHLIELRYVPDRRFSCTLTIDPFLLPKEDGPAAK